MVIQAAIAGLGVGLLPSFLVQRELADGRLATPFPGQVTKTAKAYWLAVPPRSRELPALGAFRAWLLERLAAEGLRPPAGAPPEPAGPLTASGR
jgi:DNA-binding transcriptional LysR family regulator